MKHVMVKTRALKHLPTKSRSLALIITNWPINELRKHLGTTLRNQIFLEFNCGHFEMKMESLRPSYQK